MKEYYVTCIDSFLTDWEEAKGKATRLVFICKSEDEADIVLENINTRPDMRDGELIEAIPADGGSQWLTINTNKTHPDFYKKGYYVK